ncbi:DNA methyltransferase [Enterococcus mundtii]|uniref:DNA methyltransferase n=1 Tax=Enterococcus mundtii TaxID=53346 RepID=UPI0018983E3E|nr:DNA methyltransferase [Enterococcus mundtii]MDB7100130.1 DNA methyltransferase [Enterococcus mundtii]
MIEQLSLDFNDGDKTEEIIFSHDKVFSDFERRRLESNFQSKLEESSVFNRNLVSFQGNKKASVHNWFKYREGFSTQLVESLLNQFNLDGNSVVLDPFSGSGTTAITANKLGYSSIGIDILPVAKLTYETKKEILNYDVLELVKIRNDIKKLKIGETNQNFNYITITEGAFSKKTESELVYVSNYIKDSTYSTLSKKLVQFLLMSILEEISFTRKDGQYLRWDYRSNKVVQANIKRFEKGQPPLKTKLDKGELPSVKVALLKIFNSVIEDISWAQKNNPMLNENPKKNKSEFIEGSALFKLPLMREMSVNAVVTSPPYANRYDYTRTYALELNFLGINDEKIKLLRQNLLSATVENKSKLIQLEEFYNEIGQIDRFKSLKQVYESNLTMKEILGALKKRDSLGEVNNSGIIRMIEGYFTELTFVYGELFRVCESGSYVAIVNDNVRYAGEIIPVDFISCQIAEAIGFEVCKVYTLPQKKGNSSQQMKKYGKANLRKSITVWKKK